MVSESPNNIEQESCSFLIKGIPFDDAKTFSVSVESFSEFRRWIEPFNLSDDILVDVSVCDEKGRPRGSKRAIRLDQIGLLFGNPQSENDGLVLLLSKVSSQIQYFSRC